VKDHIMAPLIQSAGRGTAFMGGADRSAGGRKAVDKWTALLQNVFIVTNILFSTECLNLDKGYSNEYTSRWTSNGSRCHHQTLNFSHRRSSRCCGTAQ